MERIETFNSAAVDSYDVALRGLTVIAGGDCISVGVLAPGEIVAGKEPPPPPPDPYPDHPTDPPIRWPFTLAA